ncbi:hypothetical protein GJAV_G00248700 [Gymnothorax javanicus]|nr:hypothetical protein GJAV_G00248700 [Gymnothorax javanicus]
MKPLPQSSPPSVPFLTVLLAENSRDGHGLPCDNGLHMDIFLHCSLLPALAIMGALSFLQHREHRAAMDDRLPECCGRFSVVVPLDVIDSLKNRWSYGFAFGVVSSSVLLLFAQEYLPLSVPPWARAFVYLVGALEVGLAYYPFFACLSTPFRFVGAVLGILYTLTWTILSLWDMVTCPSGAVLGKFQKPLLQWPRLLCLIFLLGRFTQILIKAIRCNLWLECEQEEVMLQNHQAKHVQLLLSTAQPEQQRLSQGGLKRWFERNIYEWDPCFKFPNRMIGTSIVCFIGLYAITLADYSLSDHVFDKMDNLLVSLSRLAASCNSTVNQFTHLTAQFKHFSQVAREIWFATTIFASLTSALHMFHMLACYRFVWLSVLSCYRKHLKRLWVGQKSFMPERFQNPSSAVSVAAITRYSGWQIAYTMWGYLIVHFGQFVVGLLLAYSLVLPIQQGRGLAVLSGLGMVLLTVGVVIGLVILQIGLVHIFFLQDKISPSDKQKPLALNNRKAFHNFTYFFFFYNVMMGLGNCVLRLTVSGVLGTWLVSRIDRSIVQHGYEVLDPGYSTWIGMIFADHYHSNPVMICFCHLLLARRRERAGRAPLSDSQSNTSSACVRSVKIRQRWFLLYTLMKNPQLTQLRRPQPADPTLPPEPPPSQPSPDPLSQGTLRLGWTLGFHNSWLEFVVTPAPSHGSLANTDQARPIISALLIRADSYEIVAETGLGKGETAAANELELFGIFIPLSNEGMSDLEVVKKMLRAVLQSKKSGVPLSRLQSEYLTLTGEYIPHKQLGYATMEAFVRSMPSVARMELSRTGEVVCFAAVCKETAHIAQLVARQRSSKKTGRSQLVNCQMRVKPSSSFNLNAKPRMSLRQPEGPGRPVRGGAPQTPVMRSGSVGVHPQVPEQKLCMAPPTRAPEQRLYAVTRAPVERMGQAPTTRAPEERMGQGPVIRAPEVRSPNVQLKRADLISERREKRMTLPPRFQREVQAHLSRGPLQRAPSNVNENNVPAKPRMAPASPSPPPSLATYNAQVVQSRLKEVLQKYSNGFWVSKLPQLYREQYKQELPPDALRELEHWSHICTVEKPCSTNPAERILYPTKDLPQPKPSTPVPSLARTKPAALLSSSGLKNSGPEAYKMPLPPVVLQDLSSLRNICSVEYPMPDNLHKAILYSRTPDYPADLRPRALEASRRLSSQAVPPLVIPAEEYPSVLVVEAGSTNSIILRYVGEAYSEAQEKLEDEMREFYSQSGAGKPLLNPSTGQLAAVRAEEEEEVLRAQVCEVMTDKVKVYYVDHGFAEIIGRGKLLELHEKFFRLPFQASKCKLAGLEPFCQDPAVLKSFESLACGRILLAEILERDDTPLAVLYDTSQDDDVNINTTCLKALHDKNLGNPLQVNGIYADVSVTNVCSDGTVFCHLPSRGQAKLNSILGKAEAYFHSQVTPEFLVSRPFCGKCCLAQYKGKWARVEITNLHGSRVLDIQFVDLGVPASVELFELREIPPPFLQELMVIPPQAIKCRLADLSTSGGSWPPDAVLWLREAVLNRTDCSMKVSQVEEARGLVDIYLFSSTSLEPRTSLNQQLLQSSLWNKHQSDAFLNSEPRPRALNAPTTPTPALPAPQLDLGDTTPTPATPLTLPPPLKLPQPGHNMDVLVSVACHPGHFVLQPWQDLYKLVVLMGEMILYYNKVEDNQPIQAQKNQIYAAKVENNWHRVLVKGVLTNGLVSVYELDYGKHELVDCRQLQPLINEFRQLPFQGITAQLAGVKPRQWSEEASILFRNHVEKKPLVAQVESVQEAARAWDRKLQVYLVDTAQEDRDVWVHDIVTEFTEEQSRAA